MQLYRISWNGKSWSGDTIPNSYVYYNGPWWITGHCPDGASRYVAIVPAEDEQDAFNFVKRNIYDRPYGLVLDPELNFCECLGDATFDELKANTSDRFPFAEWMCNPMEDIMVMRDPIVNVEDYADVIELMRDEYEKDKNRKYHNWDHIQEGLDHVRLDPNLYWTSPEQLLAWVAHDIYYKPGGQANEAMSVHIGLKIIDEFPVSMKDFDADMFANCIMATAGHDRPTCYEASMIVDLDLIRFAANKEMSAKYVQQLYDELSSFCTDDIDYYRKSYDFLWNFNKRKKGTVFFTPEFAHLEEAAQKNVHDQIEHYRSKVSLGN